MIGHHLKLKFEDTVLDTNCLKGQKLTIVLLNGAFSSQSDWKTVAQLLSQKGYGILTYDERGRGKSSISNDYSFDACLKDLNYLLEYYKIDKPLLVGWSYGATLAVQQAALHPQTSSGLVLVDGGFPISMMSDKETTWTQKYFKNIKWLLPLFALFGKAGKMSASQSADIVIELDEIMGKLAYFYQKITCPFYFITGRGKSVGGSEKQFAKMRNSISSLSENKYLIGHTEIEGSHLNIVQRFPEAIVEAIDKVANFSSKNPE